MGSYSGGWPILHYTKVLIFPHLTEARRDPANNPALHVRRLFAAHYNTTPSIYFVTGGSLSMFDEAPVRRVRCPPEMDVNGHQTLRFGGRKGKGQGGLDLSVIWSLL